MTSEARFMEQDRAGIMATAIGLARLAHLNGDVAKAADILHNCCDKLHEKHWAACLADGASPEDVELLLGPRDYKVRRAW